MARDEQYIDETEEQKGDGLGNALVIITTLVILVAIILVQMASKDYGAGMMK
jgi:hypothetical protein